MLATALIMGLTLASAQSTCPEILAACQAKETLLAKTACFASPSAAGCLTTVVEDTTDTLIACAKDVTTFCLQKEVPTALCLQQHYQDLSPECAQKVVDPNAQEDSDSSLEDSDSWHVNPIETPKPERHHHNHDDYDRDRNEIDDDEEGHTHRFHVKSWMWMLALAVTLTCCVRRCRKRRRRMAREAAAAAAPQQPIVVISSVAPPSQARLLPNTPLPYATLVQPAQQAQPVAVPMQVMQAQPMQPGQPGNMYPTVEQRHFYALLNRA